MLWLINSCFSAGGIGIVVVAILVIAITQYLKPARNKSYFHPGSKSVNKQKTFAKDDIPGDGHHMNKLLKDDYSERHLDEIAKCAMCLDEFSHNQMQEAGDGKMKKKVWETKFMASKDFQGSDVDGGNSYKSSVDAADKNCELSVGVPGFKAHTDTSADSKVLKQENDDVEIPDLLPDDISIDEEDEDNEEISPQAMADIEAEMLDSSILTSGSLEDDDETDVPKADEITEREDIAVQDELATDQRSSQLPISGSEIKEQRVQETQLNEIMQLMKQHPDLFGDMTKKEMSDQMSMYCVQ